jgi:hypothetical protein
MNGRAQFISPAVIILRVALGISYDRRPPATATPWYTTGGDDAPTELSPETPHPPEEEDMPPAWSSPLASWMSEKAKKRSSANEVQHEDCTGTVSVWEYSEEVSVTEADTVVAIPASFRDSDYTHITFRGPGLAIFTGTFCTCIISTCFAVERPLSSCFGRWSNCAADFPTLGLRYKTPAGACTQVFPVRRHGSTPRVAHGRASRRGRSERQAVSRAQLGCLSTRRAPCACPPRGAPGRWPAHSLPPLLPLDISSWIASYKGELLRSCFHLLPDCTPRSSHMMLSNSVLLPKEGHSLVDNLYQKLSF